MDQAEACYRDALKIKTEFDIAGKGKADPSSMIEAVRLAVELARNDSGVRNGV